MKLPGFASVFRPHFRRLALAIVLAALCLPLKSFITGWILPFGVVMSSPDDRDEVDPRTPITLEAIGLGTRLVNAELRDDSGKILAQGADQSRITFPTPLAFGVRYSIKVTAERLWFGQRLTREFGFTTLGIPQLEGPTQRMLGPDASVTLHFDRPVGEIQVKGELQLRVEPDETHQAFRLIAGDYAQERSYAIQLNWQTTNGVPLPPLSMEILTPPPLTAENNVEGLSNLGLAFPVQLTFSEPLADRASVGRSIVVATSDGKGVTGKWEWQGKRRLRFTPQPAWPPSSTIQVSIDRDALRTLRGGKLEEPVTIRFGTGTDRRIFVYLDTQQVEAVENGQVVRMFKASTGKSTTPTRAGSYYIYDRYRHKTMRSDVPRGKKGFYEVENVPYTQFFNGDMALHGAFWHNSFGRPASHGCVNLSTKDHNTRWPDAPEDAGWLYQWASLGVPVIVLQGAQVKEASKASAKKSTGSVVTEPPPRAKEPVAALERGIADP